MKRKYEKIEPMTKSDAEEVFAGGNNDQIIVALISVALHYENWQWVQAKCIEFIELDDENLINTAILCFGHIVRIHHRLDLDMVMSILQRLKSNPIHQGQVEDAMDDIAMFLSSQD